MLIFSYYYENFKDIAALTIPTIEEYAKIHGYDFYIKDKDFDHSKRIGFERIDIFLEKIDQYDWIWYLDADSMIMNQTIRLENLIDNNFDMIIAKNPENKQIIEINVGSVLIKKSEWTKIFLKHISNLENYFNHDWKTQQAIIDYINITNIQDAQKHMKIVHPRYFNSNYHVWHSNSNFKMGDLVLHPAGSSNDYRLRLFNEMKNYIIKMPTNLFVNQPYNGYN